MYKSIDKELFHVHTRRCGHAENIDDEEYVKKAVELGARRIVFTDHVPFPGNPFGNRMSIEELSEYAATINELKECYKEKIEIFCGLEVEYLPSFNKYIQDLKKMKGIDLLILGQHMYELPDKPMEWSFSLVDKSQEHKYLARATIEGISTGYFDVIAHPDRVFKRVKVWTDECKYLASEIKSMAYRMQIPLERNFASMNRKNQYRSEFWVDIENATSVIEGIDAHSIKEIEKWVGQNESW